MAGRNSLQKMEEKAVRTLQTSYGAEIKPFQ